MSHENFPCTCAVQFLHLQIFLIFLLSHVVAAYSHQLERVKKEWRKLQNLHFDLHILPTIFDGTYAYLLLLITFWTFLERFSNFEFETIYKFCVSSSRCKWVSHAGLTPIKLRQYYGKYVIIWHTWIFTTHSLLYLTSTKLSFYFSNGFLPFAEHTPSPSNNFMALEFHALCNFWAILVFYQPIVVY